MILSPIQVDPPVGDVEALPIDGGESAIDLAVSLLNTHTVTFIVAFAVALFSTPIIRRIAVAHNVIDHPDLVRKKHSAPIAYMGGVAILLAILAGIIVSYFTWGGATDEFKPVPVSVLLGIIVIAFAGLADDIWKWDPRLKIAGQLVAAAALAVEDVGVRVAEGLLRPFMGPSESTLIVLGDLAIVSGDVYYWAGTAIIAIFVLGGCNAANLIDGLDGLLSGVTAITAAGLLVIALAMAAFPPATIADGEPTLAGARIVLCFALMGAVLGFLPHNFNPATIFLGDCGSLLIGFVTVCIILMMGEYGQTHLVFAGLIVFSVPIMDTALAIVRRKLSGMSMSEADDQHIHHQLKRVLGGVKRAVFALYAISFAFAVVGVSLALLVLMTGIRVRVVYAIAIVLFGFIGVIAFKAARRHEYAIRQQQRASAKAKPAPRQSAPAKGAVDLPRANPPIESHAG